MLAGLESPALVWVCDQCRRSSSPQMIGVRSRLGRWSWSSSIDKRYEADAKLPRSTGSNSADRQPLVEGLLLTKMELDSVSSREECQTEIIKSTSLGCVLGAHLELLPGWSSPAGVSGRDPSGGKQGLRRSRPEPHHRPLPSHSPMLHMGFCNEQKGTSVMVEPPFLNPLDLPIRIFFQQTLRACL